ANEKLVQSPSTSPTPALRSDSYNPLGIKQMEGKNSLQPFNIKSSTTNGGTEAGKRLANKAEAHAKATNTEGWCYKAVCDVVNPMFPGTNLHGGSAYMAKDQLKANPNFENITSSHEDNLNKLPAGAIVVFNKNGRRPHGHIAISLGDGREASDKIREQLTPESYGTTLSGIFMPKDNSSFA
ncbi:MAG TPA: hypothetical protein V6C96_00910, partial [Vampirovibrionales bacterium]